MVISAVFERNINPNTHQFTKKLKTPLEADSSLSTIKFNNIISFFFNISSFEVPFTFILLFSFAGLIV